MGMLFRRAKRAVLRYVKRFLADTPSNAYERIVFSAMRDTALTFGKVGA
jgi:hypothetical protein